MKINSIKVGEERANCYVVSDSEQNVFVVDPGDEPERIIELISEIKNARVLYILLTHGHFDHVRAVDGLKEKYPNAEVVIGEEDIDFIRNMPEQGLFVHKFLKNIKSKIVTYSNGEYLPFGPENIKLIATPGHTPGGLSYLFQGNLFTGDTLFYHTIGRTDLPLASSEVLQESLNKIIALPGETKILPGHGRSTTIKEEQLNNPFLI